MAKEETTGGALSLKSGQWKGGNTHNGLLKKIHDFSLHQFPTVNLLQELAEHTGISVTILVAQIKFIPEEIAPGLTPAMTEAVAKTCQKLSQILSLQAK